MWRIFVRYHWGWTWQDEEHTVPPVLEVVPWGPSKQEGLSFVAKWYQSSNLFKALTFMKQKSWYLKCAQSGNHLSLSEISYQPLSLVVLFAKGEVLVLQIDNFFLEIVVHISFFLRKGELLLIFFFCSRPKYLSRAKRERERIFS